VVHELVDQETGQNTHVGQAVLEHRARRRHFTEGGGCLVADHRATVLEHDIAARALGEAAGDLVVDDLVLLGVSALQLRRRQSITSTGTAAVKRRPSSVTQASSAPWVPAGVVDLLGGDGRCGGRRVAEQGLEPQLVGLSIRRRSDFWPNSWRWNQPAAG